MKLQNYRFKEIGLVIFLISISICPAKAQKFMHYYMNDHTFQGFYTESIDSIKHSVEDGKLQILNYIGDECIRIPAEKVDSIVFEGANPTTGDLDGYRIYELDNTEGGFKKAYVDNRANVIMSKTGQFAENDTIVFTSAYCGYKYLFITNENGEIARLFDGKNLLCFDYNNEDGKINVFGSVTTTLDNDVSDSGKTRAAGKSSFFKNCQDIIVDKLKKNKDVVDAGLDCGSAWTDFSISCFLQSMEEIQNNPESHNQLLIVNGLFLAKDIIGIATSLATLPLAGPVSVVKFCVDLTALMVDFWGLLQQIYPSKEQMEIYKEYYRNKYQISLKVLPVENVTHESATLNGSFYFANKLKGRLYFVYSPLWNDGFNEVDATCTTSPSNPYSHNLQAFVEGLTEKTEYIYYPNYECKIDGLSFTYSTNEAEDFTTASLPDPQPVTGEVSDVQDQTATVKCTFKNIREGAVCGVEYSCEGGKNRQVGSPQEGTQQISISGLKPNTQYTYAAYVEYNGIPYYGEEKTFQTKPANLAGGWTCTEYIYNSITGQTKPKSYFISLYEDGTAEIHNTSTTYISASWSFTGNTIKISAMTLATQTANAGVNYVGTTETPDNPTTFKGSMDNWSYNSVVGYVGRGGNDFTLSR